jgi:hypothetical protein
MKPCAVKGCKTPAVACFDTWLCEAHGNQANAARDAAGLSLATWAELVAYVAAWVARGGKAETGRAA